MYVMYMMHMLNWVAWSSNSGGKTWRLAGRSGIENWGTGAEQDERSEKKCCEWGSGSGLRLWLVSIII